MKHKIRKWNQKKKKNDIVEISITPVKAIRLFCVNECMAGQPSLVPGCTDPHCPLYPYRMNSNPERALKGEHLEKNRQRIMTYNQNREKRQDTSMDFCL
jgi:hypothetical protein